MALNLSAVFRVRDEGTSKLRKIMQQTEKLSKSTQQATKATNSFRDASGRLRDAMGRYTSEGNRAINTNKKFATSLSSLRVSSSGASASLKGLQSSLVGIAGAYLSLQTAKSAFEATIGAAAKMETSNVTISAMFNDDQLTKDYTAMMKRMAIDSPVLNLTDMYSSSKSLISMTKDLKDLESAFKIVEKLQVLNSDVGTEQAVFSLKEMWQGDSTSMKEVFGLNGQQLNLVKKLGVPEQIKAIEMMLSGMNITDSVVQKLGSTTNAQLNSLKERLAIFMQDIGEAPNTRLGDYLKTLNERFENMDVESVANKLGAMLDSVTEKVIKVSEFIWKWREPIAYITGAVGAALTAFMAIGAISLLANPIALIAAGVAAAAVGFKALYDNSEPVRNAINGIVTQAKALWEAFQNGGTGGLLDRLFGSGTGEKVVGIVDTIKAKIAEFTPFAESFKQTLINVGLTLSDVFTNAWSIISPILSGLWSVLQVVGGVAAIVFNNVIAPALQFLAQLFTTLWSIAQPILTVLGALLSGLGTIVLWLWNTALSPLVDFIMGALKNAFEVFTDALSVIAGWFEKVGGWANTAKDLIGKFADKIASIKLPDWVTNGISTVVTTVGKAIGAKPDGSHANGLWSVPFNSYLSELHVGETVLPRREAEAYRSLAGSNGFNFLSSLQSQASGLGTSVAPQNTVANYVTNNNTRNITNDSTVSKLTSVYDMSQVSPIVNNVLEPIINVNVNPIADVFNEIVIKQPSMSAGDSVVSNDYSYDRVSESITNQTTNNNTYNSTTNNTTNNGASGSKAQNQRPVMITGNQFTVREEADIDKIGWALFKRLQMAEAAGAS